MRTKSDLPSIFSTHPVFSADSKLRAAYRVFRAPLVIAFRLCNPVLLAMALGRVVFSKLGASLMALLAVAVMALPTDQAGLVFLVIVVVFGLLLAVRLGFRAHPWRD